ncbi:MAG: hypothetical protein GEU97_24550 [Actinophytocola sp.]|nr:hypothetical protein [Actinophytocola sp.]
MDPKVGQIVAQWALMFAIVFGVWVMHHGDVWRGHGESGHGTAVTMSAPTHSGLPGGQEAPVGGVDLLHLCLAILGMAAGVVLRWLWRGVSRPGVSPQWTWQGRPPARQRPPPRRAREILHRVCVLRV